MLPGHTPLVFVMTLGFMIVPWGHASAQSTPDSSQADIASRTQLSGQMELARLVDVCAARLNVAIEYDPAVLKGTVTLRTGTQAAGKPDAPGDAVTGLTDAELWALMNELLASHGFTTVRPPGARVTSVVRLAEAAGAAALDLSRAAPGEVPRATGQSADPGFTSLVLRLKHRAPKDVIDAAGKALSRAAPGGSGAGAGSIVALGEPAAPRGLVLISDLASRIDQALALIELIDTPGPGSVVEFVAVRNVAPTAMTTLVAQVTAKRELISGQKVAGEVLPAPVGTGGNVGSGSSGAARGAGGVLVIAPAEHLEYWRTLIQSLDAGEPALQRTYLPRAFAAADVASLIETTARTARDADGRPAGDEGDDRWRLVIDPLTGSLIITATPAQHAAIEKLIAHLESTPPTAKRPVRSFVLKNRNVKDVLPIVQELLQQGILGSSAALDESNQALGARTELGANAAASARMPSDARLAPSTSATPPASGPATPSQVPADNGTSPTASMPVTGAPSGSASTTRARTNAAVPANVGSTGGGGREMPLSISADEATNTLIAMGGPAMLEQLAQLITQLDVRQPQVLLEMLLVSLTDAQTLDLGVELEKLNIGLGGETRGRLASLFGIANRAGPTPVVGAAGGQAVVLNPGDFSVVVRALQTLNKGRSLSMPSVLVTSNEKASLDSILEQPFATTNTSNSVTSSTSFGGTLPAGTQLTITPQIAEGDHLTLEYQVSLSSFTGSSSNPNLPPPRQQNQVQSVATIPDGHTVVVGGIDLFTDNQGTSQVPLLGQIPILGEAFKSRSNNDSKQRFYVFIRANILRSRGFEDLKHLSGVRLDEIGVDDGWPEIEPRVIR